MIYKKEILARINRNLRKRKELNLLLYHTSMFKSIKFRKVRDVFQVKLKKEIPKIKDSPIMFIFAVNTNNFYEMPTEDHEKLKFH